MASRDGESDSDSSDDDLYSSSAGSDINIDDPLDSFSSDTDDDDDPNSQSSLETFSSQISDSEGPGFWSSELHPVSIAPFSEETGPSHDLTPNDNILKYFYLMLSEDFSRESPLKPTGTLLRSSRKEVTATRIGLTLLLRKSRRILAFTSLWAPTSFQV